MSQKSLSLEVLPETFAICRLEVTQSLTDWAEGGFVSITRTAEELSIVCSQDRVPSGY